MLLDEILPLDHNGPINHRFRRFESQWLEHPVFSLFDDIAQVQPQQPAIYDRHGVISYSELRGLALRIGAAIDKIVPPGEPVAIALPITHQYPAAMLGLLATGRPYIPLDTSFPAARLRHILAQSQVTTVLSCGETLNILRDSVTSQISPPLIVIDVDNLESGSYTWTPLGKADSVAYILYTSGSTGRPKGVYQNQRGLLHDIMQYTNSIHLSNTDRCTLLYSPSVNGAIRDLYGALLNGATLCMLDLKREGLGRVAELLGLWQVSIFHAMPPVLRSLLRQLRDTSVLKHIRLAYVAGDRLFPSDVRLLRADFPPGCLLYTGIGSTECATIYRQWFVPVDWPLDSALLPVGFAVPDRDMLLLGTDGTPVELGASGDIVIRSRYLARGYWRDLELTRSAFSTDPDDANIGVFKTGDQGRLRSDGLLEFIGRVDRQVKIRGYRVEPAEIESALRDLEGVTEAMVMPYQHQGETRLAAYVQLRNDDISILETIKTQLAAQFPAHLRPTALIPLEKLPLLGNFKVDMQSLQKILETNPPLADNNQATDGITQKSSAGLSALVVTAWKETLDLKQVRMEQSFEDAGGDSLEALELLLALEDVLGRRLPSDLMDVQVTPTQLVARITEHLSIDDTPADLTKNMVKGSWFVVPGGLGAVIQYRHIADALAPKFSSTMIDFSPNLELELERIHSIKEFAALYVEAIVQQVSPQTPILLFGHSFGGRVAFEIACQLHIRSYHIAMLALIDIPTTSFLYLPKRVDKSASTGLLGQLGVWRKRLKHVYRDWIVWLVSQRQYHILRFITGLGITLIGSNYATSTLKAIRHVQVIEWKASYYPGVVTLFLTQDTAALLAAKSITSGWECHCNQLKIVNIDGDHGSCVNPPHNISLIKHLSTIAHECLETETRGYPPT